MRLTLGSEHGHTWIDTSNSLLRPVTDHDRAQTLKIPEHIVPPLWRHRRVAAGSAVLAALALALVMAWRHSYRDRRHEFWDYNLGSRVLRRTHADNQAGLTPDLGMQTLVDSNLQIRPEDQPHAIEQLKRHLHGNAVLFLSEHRVREDNEGASKNPTPLAS